MFKFSKKKTLIGLLGFIVSTGLIVLFAYLAPSGNITELAVSGVIFRILSLLFLSSAVGFLAYIFSDIKHDRIKKLDRVIIMKICLGLHLGYQESVELLQSAGCTFDNSLFDAIIQWYLHQEDYELEEVDIALEANQLDCIFSCE